MLPRAALVSATRKALFPVVHPNMIAAPTINRAIAVQMLTVLFGSVGKAKGTEGETLLDACLQMFAPGADAVGETTGLWRPVSRHPLILALAVRTLINNAVFTSSKELRDAMQEAHSSIRSLFDDTDRWLKLLKTSDRLVFEFDRDAWNLAYRDVGPDVVREMQEREEEGYEDDDGEDVPPSPRWAALESMK
jgi:hypothetical protein